MHLPSKSKVSSCLRTTNENTVKGSNERFNEYYGPLIIDFTRKHRPKASPNLSRALSTSRSQNSIPGLSSLKEPILFHRPKDKSKSKQKIVHVLGARGKSKSQKHELSSTRSQRCLRVPVTEAESFPSNVFT